MALHYCVRSDACRTTQAALAATITINAGAPEDMINTDAVTTKPRFTWHGGDGKRSNSENTPAQQETSLLPRKNSSPPSQRAPFTWRRDCARKENAVDSALARARQKIQIGEFLISRSSSGKESSSERSAEAAVSSETAVSRTRQTSSSEK